MKVHRFVAISGKEGAANQIPFFSPGFQQFGEKQCGKELSCAINVTHIACFDGLHCIRCEDEQTMKFSRAFFESRKSFFFRGK